MKVFRLPDLGEGLTEAEIREWFVKPGDTVSTGDLLVAVETAKAIVEIPAPWDGTIQKCYADSDDMIDVGSPLVAYADDASDTGQAQAPEKDASPEDRGAVVGEVTRGDNVLREEASPVGRARAGIKATPAVRALARKHDLDLSVVTPSGPDGLITTADVERVANIFARVGPLERLRGPRRAMARTMSHAHGEVADVTVTDDADIGDWPAGTDITMRLIRAIAAGCRAQPGLNAWYDSHAPGRRLLAHLDLGIAVDTPDGLFVPVLRDAGNRSSEDLRQGLERLKADVHARRIPVEEMRGYTFTLSNFGAIGGRYANPVVVPPTVAILGAGRIGNRVVASKGKPAVRPVLPLSLTFDHRAVTGGEASRFLMAVVDDLTRAD